MNLRFINALILSTVLSLGVFFGVNINSFGNTAGEIDASHTEYLNEEYKKTIEEITNDIIINSTNNFNNKDTGKKSTGNSGGSQKEVNFTNFYDMYAYAVNKVNNASLLESNTTGALELQPGASIGAGGITLLTLTEPMNFNITFLKQKNGREKLFRMNFKGSALGHNLNFSNQHYTAGINYEYWTPGVGTVTIPGSTYIEKFNWDMVQPFHLATEQIAKNLDSTEIISWYKDNRGVYHSIVEINTSKFNSNLTSILGGVLGMDVPITFSQIRMTIKVDSYGNFISLEYNDKVEIKRAGIMGFSISNAKANLVLTENFVTIDNDYVTIKK